MNLRGLVKGLDDLNRNRQAQLALIMQGEAAVEPLIQFLLGPPSLHPEPRCLAAEALRIIGGDRAIEGLIQGLTVNDVSGADPVIQLAEEAVRNWIAEQLGYLGDRRAVPVLLDALSRYHLASAATALARFGVAEAIPEIASLLEDDFLRERLAEALQIFGRIALPYLEETLFIRRCVDLEEHPASVRRRACAARLLGAYHDPRANTALSKLLTDDAEEVRIEAALALLTQGEIERSEQAARLISILLVALDKGDFDVILRSQDALCAAGPVVRPHLREALATGRMEQPNSVRTTLSDEARLVLMDCFVKLRDAQAVEIMTALLREPNPRIRARAGWALERLKEKTSDVDDAL